MSDIMWKVIVFKCFAEATLEMILQGVRRLAALLIKRRRLIRWLIVAIWLTYKLFTKSFKLVDTIDNLVVDLVGGLLFPD